MAKKSLTNIHNLYKKSFKIVKIKAPKRIKPKKINFKIKTKK